METERRRYKRVAVIGAGVAGVAACHALRKRGIECVVFESKDRVGGLWVDNYYGACVQLPHYLYEYPEQRFKDDVDANPSMDQVCEYLETFVDANGIRDSFRFKSKVTSVLQLEDSSWALSIEDLTTGESRIEEFAYLVMCNGLYSDKPNRIKLEGEQHFQGKLIHSSEYRSTEVFAGKNVVVVGAGKSGIDAATTASTVAKSVSHVGRTKYFTVPLYLGPVNNGRLFFTRGLLLFLSPFYHGNRVTQALHWLLTPVKWPLLKLFEIALLVSFRIPFSAWPNTSLLHEAHSTRTSVSDINYLKALRKKKIRVYKTTVSEVEGKTANLANGKVLEADLIVLATGWDYTFQIFDGDIGKRLQPDEDGLYLYKNMLPTTVNGLAFVGSNCSSYVNPFTDTVQSVWLAQLLAGDRPMPKRKEMEEDLRKMKASKRRFYPTERYRATIVQAHSPYYHDDLMREMGMGRKVRGFWSFLSYWLQPQWPKNWNSIVEEAHTVRI
ncbi:hypothetical protein NDN08_005041 [Rhodosorus marinus]|uniref:Flavin-containing monooxygenase n=1 Tax=Rhodosorus marinus TaxID=101924 RepID=A0AAV8V0B5_9RHOD|nr:hypothetical protein NDN08_005041 [Rhodosorus marinus]